jgi:hypothetical protein
MAPVYYFDGYEATIKQVGMTEVGEEGADSRLSCSRCTTHVWALQAWKE